MNGTGQDELDTPGQLDIEGVTSDYGQNTPRVILEDDMAEGIQIVSDGTVEGTRCLLDGREVKGVTEATWKFNARTRSAELVLTFRHITVDVSAPVDPTVSAALATLTS